MLTNYDNAQSTADDRRGAECCCPDDRCAGYHHEVGDTCWCAIFTGQPLEAGERR
ncbi:MAG: hypothetical protein ACTH2U_08390 [Brevibacterium sp.]